MAVRRVPVEEARRKVAAGEALLVCAYAEPAQCASLMLEGAIPLKALMARLPGLSPTQELILYCA